MSDIFKVKSNNQWVGLNAMIGPQGETGPAAGFGTPTATIDANVGTPAVTITSSGPDTAKIFDFAFSNLKGETGDAAGFDSPTVSVSTLLPGSTPTASVTASGPDTAKVFNFSFGLPTTPNFTTITIPSNSWTIASNGKYTATVSVPGMTSNTNALIGASGDSMQYVVSCDIYCSGQGTNTLTFTAYIIPAGSVEFGVYWV